MITPADLEPYVHPRDKCRPPCPIHAPSDHHMVGWQLTYRPSKRMFERLCPEHSYGHPDPDNVEFIVSIRGEQDRWVLLVHGTCGGSWCCCTPPTAE